MEECFIRKPSLANGGYESFCRFTENKNDKGDEEKVVGEEGVEHHEENDSRVVREEVK
jgi:hypothetical protein